MAKSGARSTWYRDPFNIGGLAIAVAVLIFASYAVVTSLSREDSTDYVSTYTPPPALQIDPLRVSVLGDSYSAGVGASSSGSWTSVAERKNCWSVNAMAQSSTGYVSPGPEGSAAYTDPERLALATANNPELIIVQGSTNDAGKPGIQGAATAVYNALKPLAPQATIIVVGPTAAPLIDPAENATSRDQIRAAAEGAGLLFIDPLTLGWLTTDGMYAPDRLHPNGKGHIEYADDVRAAMNDRQVQVRDSCALISPQE